MHVFIGDTEPQIENIVQDLRNYDPELVLKQVIPDIVKQGQNLMKNKKISVEQFSGMMKTVFQMKEQVMMHQAEKRHNNQQMIISRQGENMRNILSNIKENQANIIDNKKRSSISSLSAGKKYIIS